MRMYFLGPFIFVTFLVAHAKNTFGSKQGASQSCPAPKLCEALAEAQASCDFRKKSCGDFYKIFRKLLPKYNCRVRDDSMENENRAVVPAIWLCDNYETAVRFLYDLKTPAARKLFNSNDLQSTLKGPLVLDFMKNKKKSVNKISKMKRKKIVISENTEK